MYDQVVKCQRAGLCLSEHFLIEYVSHIRVLNYVFVMNVAWIQPRNGYNQYYFALDSTFFRGQVNKTEARPRPDARGRSRSMPTLTPSVLTGLDEEQPRCF